MENSPENEKYWRERKKDDPRLDWRIGEEDWIGGYLLSTSHPHRELVKRAVQSLLPIKSLLEVGCNVGPNLAVLQDEFKNAVLLCGLDVNKDALQKGSEVLPEIVFIEGSAKRLPFPNKSFDIVLVDAVLMYISPEKIVNVINEIVRVARKGIIFVEWFDSDLLGSVQFWHWARDYKTLLEQRGMKVEMRKITQEDWPSENWSSIGYVFIGKWAENSPQGQLELKKEGIYESADF